MNRKDFAKALAAFEKVRKLNPSYREVASLQAQAESLLDQQTRLDADAPATAGDDVDSLYQEALAAHVRGDYATAVATYEKLQTVQPNYRDVPDRLAQAQTSLVHLTVAQPASVSAGRSSLYVYGAMAVFIAVPLFGFALFSPTVKARLCLLRGDYTAAAQIYERLLARNPQRVKLYPALANLYLLMGRHDERALKVYKTILQLNLATNNRDEITATVGQHYLSEGRTDSDALDVLENLLKAEHRKQGKIEQKQTTEAKAEVQ
jgi:tetratricopeptide (TPR) repeat protein